MELFIQVEDESATYRDAYLLLSNRYDVPEEVAAVYVRWECNKEGAEKALSHREMVRYLFNASHRICCYGQQIQVYLDTTGDRFSMFIEKFWPPHPFLRLRDWHYSPITA